ncbi:hypothetical protein CBM2633_U10038 [Cupriavidus taiwanensis]|uniref:hypothetical protein n=1 Tax=Cupriavidus taiwanensis TaxID=164546 RepID=UPI000E166482|nr:hypothetical protein [Cupriavidus taiwanensis]SPA23694.1 hypothetical protein CBM2633_U10038 [Cupriavidus taiwanensis]
MRTVLRIANAAFWLWAFLYFASQHWDDHGRVLGNAVIPLILGGLIEWSLRKKKPAKSRSQPN